MVKYIITVFRKPGMSPQAFAEYWKSVHAPLGAKVPGLRRYVLDIVGAGDEPMPPEMIWQHGKEGDAEDVAGYAELWFDTLNDLACGMTSPQGKAAARDLAQFTDLKRMSAFVVQEHHVL